MSIKEQIEAKQKELAEIRAKEFKAAQELEALKQQLDKWEPKPGCRIISSNGRIEHVLGRGEYACKTGSYYQTDETAEAAKELLAPIKLMVNYLLEHAPKYKYRVGEHNCFIYYEHSRKQYYKGYHTHFEYVGQIYIHPDIVDQLLAGLNKEAGFQEVSFWEDE